MQSFFSMPARPDGQAGASPPPSPAMNFFGNLMAKGNARMERVGRPTRKQNSLLAIFGGILAVLALAYLTERKWGALTRVQLRTLGPLGYTKLETAAKKFRNELYRLHKERKPDITPGKYVDHVYQANLTMRSTYSDNFHEDVKDVKDKKSREDLWSGALTKYITAADLSLLRDAATEFFAVRQYLKGHDFQKDDKVDDDDDWEKLFDFDVSAFQKWAKKFLADEKNKGEADKMKAYMEIIPKFLAARDNYILQNNVALGWLEGQHDEARKAHPDADKMMSKEEKEKAKKEKKEKKEDGDDSDEEDSSWKSKVAAFGSKLVGERATAAASAMKAKVTGIFGGKGDDDDEGDVADS